MVAPVKDISPFEEDVINASNDVLSLAAVMINDGFLTKEGDLTDISKITDPDLKKFIEPVIHLNEAIVCFHVNTVPLLRHYTDNNPIAFRDTILGELEKDPSLEESKGTMFDTLGQSPFEKKVNEAAEGLVLLATEMRQKGFFPELAISTEDMYANSGVRLFLSPLDHLGIAVKVYRKDTLPKIMEFFRKPKVIVARK